MLASGLSSSLITKKDMTVSLQQIEEPMLADQVN